MVLLLPVACHAPARNGASGEHALKATIPGIPNARFWGDDVSPELGAWIHEGFRRERAYLDAQGVHAWPDSTFLALSGGGSDGAFGAGLLCGWTQHGDRPTFRVVTGVSTGAIIAPFAFVGPDYDHVLRTVYTTLSTRDIATRRSLVDGLLSDSLVDTSNLRHLLDRYVDQEFLDRVAAEYQKGRGLIIGTTNMDAQRPVLWSMGAIAASGHPDSLQLFRDVMIASAAIPGVFPPVMIRVEGPDGRVYDEMHADGGVTSQVFLYPAALSLREVSRAEGVQRHRSVYVIRNAQLTPHFETVPRRTLPIAQRAVATLIKTQGVGDLYRIYLGCLRDDLDYRLAHIPDDFHVRSREFFDPQYMKALFDMSFDLAAAGFSWKTAPPGFEPPAAQHHPPGATSHMLTAPE